MTELANIGAVIVGVFFSYYVTDYFLALFYHVRFFSRDQYMDLYDELDTNYHYRTIRQISSRNYKSYAEYSKHHSKIRSKAYSEYRKLLNGMLLRLAICVLLPVVVVFAVSSDLGVLIYCGLLGGFIFKAIVATFIKKRTRDFYITLIHSLVLEG